MTFFSIFVLLVSSGALVLIKVKCNDALRSHVCGRGAEEKKKKHLYTNATSSAAETFKVRSSKKQSCSYEVGFILKLDTRLPRWGGGAVG